MCFVYQFLSFQGTLLWKDLREGNFMNFRLEIHMAEIYDRCHRDRATETCG